MKKVIILTAVFTILISIFVADSASAFSEQRKFIGQEYDADSGLDYLNARYYNPSIGRFTSEDPMFWNFDQSWLADPQSQNAYAYARNNPIIYLDPNGEKAEVIMKEIYMPLGKNLVPISGAHGFIQIIPEVGSGLTGSKYTIGGYPSDGKPSGGKLQAQINNPGDYYCSSNPLAVIPLALPKNMTISQYDQALLNSGNNLSKTDLGTYTFPGRPISSNANSGNTWAQVILDAGGKVPEIQNIYTNNHAPFIYFPLGSGNPMNIPSYQQRVESVINNKAQSTLNSISSTLSQLTKELKKVNGN